MLHTQKVNTMFSDSLKYVKCSYYYEKIKSEKRKKHWKNIPTQFIKFTLKWPISASQSSAMKPATRIVVGRRSKLVEPGGAGRTRIARGAGNGSFGTVPILRCNSSNRF